MKYSRTTVAVLCFAIAFALALPACDSGDGGEGIELGNDDKMASSLSEPEATSLCEKATETMAAAEDPEADQRFICITGGLFTKAFSNDDVEACEAAYDECMTAEPEESGYEPDYNPCDDIYKVTKDCDATLGEIEACLNDTLLAQKEMDDQFGDLSCKSTEEDLNAVMDLEPGEPESCKELDKKCPGIADAPGTSRRRLRPTTTPSSLGRAPAQ